MKFMPDAGPKLVLSKNGVINSILTGFGLSRINIINTPTAVVLGMVYDFLPFMLLPIYNSMTRIRKDWIEAARDLGAGNVTIFLKIILPLTVSGIISGIVMVFVPSLTSFAISQVLGGGHVLLIGNVIEQDFYAGKIWKGFCDTDYDLWVRRQARGDHQGSWKSTPLYCNMTSSLFATTFLRKILQCNLVFQSHTFFFHADPLLLSLYLFHPAEIPDTEIVFHDRRVTVNTFLGSQSRKRCSTVRTVQSQTGILLILDHILILDIDQFHVILGLFFMLFTASYYFSVLF